MNKKDLLSKLAQVYEEHGENTKPILFPSDIPRQDIEDIAKEIFSALNNYNINIDKKELEKLSKEIAEGYLFELEVDKLINKTFEEIKKRENLSEDITLDKFIESKEGLKIFEDYLDKTKEKWEKTFKLEKELKDLEKMGTFIILQAQESIGLMKINSIFLKDPSKIEKYAINLTKNRKGLNEFLLLLFKIKKEKDQPTNIQQKILAEKDFIGFVLSTLEEIKSKVEIDESVINEIKQNIDTLKHKIITVFKNIKHLSQETTEKVEKLKQDLIKDTSSLDIDKTLENAIKHAIKLKTAIKTKMEISKQEIKKREEYLNNINKRKEEDSETIDNISLQEFSEKIEKMSKESQDRNNTIYDPIEIVNLFKITHREEKLKNLDKYIAYHWIYKMKKLEIMKSELTKVSIELAKKEMIELERHRK